MSRESMWAKQSSLKPIHPHTTEAEFWSSGEKYAEEHLAKHIDPSESVLDFGCGVGRISKYIKCRQLYLYDVNPQYLLEAVKNTRGIYDPNIFSTDAPFIDVSFAISVFIHMNYVTAEENFKKLATISSKMLLQLPVYQSAAQGNDWIDVTTYHKDQILAWCEDVNFEAKDINVNPGRFNFRNVGQWHHLPILFQRKSS